jgi:hypothetical protein
MDHDAAQAVFDFLAGPGEAHGVLGHFEAGGGHAAGVGGLARAVEDLVLEEDVDGLGRVGMLAPSETRVQPFLSSAGVGAGDFVLGGAEGRRSRRGWTTGAGLPARNSAAELVGVLAMRPRGRS